MTFFIIIIIIIVVSPFWFIVELITKSFDTVPVSLLVQRVGGLVCVRKTHWTQIWTLLCINTLRLLQVSVFLFYLTFNNNKKTRVSWYSLFRIGLNRCVKSVKPLTIHSVILGVKSRVSLNAWGPCQQLEPLVVCNQLSGLEQMKTAARIERENVWLIAVSTVIAEVKYGSWFWVRSAGLSRSLRKRSAAN